MVGNNALAPFPDFNGFVAGIKIPLADDGVNTMEFPHLVTTMEGSQFDSMHQKHYCYLSYHTVEHVFAAHGLTLFDVVELLCQGGSL